VYTKPTEPRSIGGVLDDGLRLWREAFAKTWALAVMGRLMVAIPTVLLANTAVDATRLSMSQKFAIMMGGQSQGHVWIFYLVLLVSYVFHNAVLLRVAGVAENQQTTIGGSLNKGLVLMPRLLLFYIFLIIGGIILGVIAVIPSVVVSMAVKSPVLVGIVVGLIFGCGSIYLAVRIFLAYISLVVDDKPAFESLQLSWSLTRGNWWRTTAIFTVVFIIAIVLSAAMYLLAGVFVAVWGLTSITTIAAIQVISVLVYALLGSLYPAVLYAAFEDLKLRREGSDLVGRVNALAAQ
jgi:hypothetical protein